MVNKFRSDHLISLHHVPRTQLAWLLLKAVQLSVVMIFSLISAAAVHSQNTFIILSPEYSSCGNVSINGVVDTTPPTLGLVWDWGDGSKTTSWFPAAHRYAANGSYNVTVSAAGCNTHVRTATAQVTNADIPGCPLPGSATFYHLMPYNLHLTPGAESSVPLHVVDQDGNPVPGTLTFSISDPQDLVSISPSGYVTALRAENTSTEIGVMKFGRTDCL
jgi:hypothetical protein